MKVKENDYICGTCKHKYTKDCFVYQHNEYWLNDYATCIAWTDPDEVEQTDDEKRANAGCDEAHRIMVEGREIE